MVEQENTYASPVEVGYASTTNSSLDMLDFLSSASLIAETTTKIEAKNEHNVHNSLDSAYYYEEFSSFDAIMTPLEEPVNLTSQEYFEDIPNSFRNTCSIDIYSLKPGDIFQRDNNDIIQTPTLAKLNSQEESLFDLYDDIYLENKYTTKNSFYSEFDNVAPNNSSRINFPDFKMTVKDEESLLKNIPEDHAKQKSIFKILKTAAATPKKAANYQITGNESNYPATNINTNINTISSTSTIPDKIFEDSDGSDSNINSEHSSDINKETAKETDKFASTDVNFLEKKKSRFFWQYNIQSKGPKGFRMNLTEKSLMRDTTGVSDPVFNSQFPIKGIKYSGKARKGDGNDLTPNPKKLYNIGLELENLNNVIDCLTPANELPASARTKSRKEKNKLASRACRLKKKAHHEANKLKLFGLRKEQKNLTKCIKDLKKRLGKDIEKNWNNSSKKHSTEKALKSLVEKKAITKVAGCTPHFVNQVLKTVASGDETGGLNNI